MARKLLAESLPASAPAAKGAPPTKVVIPHDATNECHVLGSAAADPDTLAALAKKLLPDHFAVPENREAWAALVELNRKNLEVTPASITIVASAKVAAYIQETIDIATSDASGKNLDWHVGMLLWDAARVRTATNALPAFLEALRDPKAEASRVQALARAVGNSMDGYKDASHILVPEEIVRTQMVEIDKRVAGHAVYPFGIDSLDWYDKKSKDGDVEQRLIPGAAPGMITVVTALSGHGKTTVTARMVLGMAYQGRKVLYGAWEMNPGISLELFTCLALNWSRSDLMRGKGPIRTVEGRAKFKQKMGELSQLITFVDNPFRRRSGEKRPTNARNLDLLQGYIEDSGCDVFVGDLFTRILVDKRPEEEEEALLRMQSMMLETRCHGILLAQQRLKDVENRLDQRPTREGIKGSGAWTEVADNMLAPYRPSFSKNVADDTLEMLILKQRYGVYPIAVTFDWDADKGSITNGRSTAYARPGQDDDNPLEVEGKKPGGKKFFGGGR